jgi:dethiobiotin synthetase
VVARFQIGMINHILLTLSACVDYSLKVKGIILNDLTDWKGQVKKEVLIQTIEKVSKVRVVATIPFMENDTPKKVAEALESSRSLSTKKSLFHY